MLNPSRLYLPKLDNPPLTILDYLCLRFPHMDRAILQTRLSSGKIFLENGNTISIDTPYRFGITLFYYREAVAESQIPFQEQIIFQNQDILVADKPHYLPVTPAGSYVNQSLLARLQKHTGLPELSPIHRLDIGTAGIVLFSLKREHRHLYHSLFTSGNIVREYFAVASIFSDIDCQQWVVENRLVPGEPWFRMKIVPGIINAITRIILKERRANRGLFQLFPSTGKKHQLRIHLATLGFPIVNDPLYPEIENLASQDYSNPMQLLAKRLLFLDPISGKEMEFESKFTLQW
ncbi:MAG: pseudouridine synthase [Acidobacteriota bacterium]